VVPPDPVGPLGTLALATDPTGASFGLWQAGETTGAGVVNEPGGLTWEDLRSPDPDSARSFYSGVFGFVHAPVEGAPPQYQTFAAPQWPDRPLGGIGGLEVDGQAPHWLVTFGVVSAPAAVQAATHHGGVIATPAFDTPFGAMAGIADPDGAVFWVVEST
jgi:predicted enzyme related to lactoylglutathione lyase